MKKGLLLALALCALQAHARGQTRDTCLVAVWRNDSCAHMDAMGRLATPLTPYKAAAPIHGVSIMAHPGARQQETRPAHEGLFPLFPLDAAGLMTTEGHWILPLQKQAVGHLAGQLFWSCKNCYITRGHHAPYHAEQGRFAIHAASGTLMDSLSAIAVPKGLPLILVHKAGRIAVMAPDGRMLSPFAYDMALEPHVGYREQPPQWPWALALRSEGKWVAMSAEGATTALDWPPHPGDIDPKQNAPNDPRNVPWLCQVSHHIPYQPPGSAKASIRHHPRSLSHADNFPSKERLQHMADSLRSRDLAALGYQATRTPAGLTAIQTKGGRPVVPPCHCSFQAMEGRLLRWTDTLPYPSTIKDRQGSPIQVLHGLLDDKGNVLRRPSWVDVQVVPGSQIIHAKTRTDSLYRVEQGSMIPIAPGTAQPLGESWFATWAGDSTLILDSLGKCALRIPGQHTFDFATCQGNAWCGTFRDTRCWDLRTGAPTRVLPLDYMDDVPAALRYLEMAPAANCPECGLYPIGDGWWVISKGDGMSMLLDPEGKTVVPWFPGGLEHEAGYVILRHAQGGQELRAVNGDVLLPRSAHHIHAEGCGLFTVESGEADQILRGVYNAPSRRWVWPLQPAGTRAPRRNP